MFRIGIVWIFLLSQSLASEQMGTRNVFGEDNRYPLENLSYPLSTIVKIKNYSPDGSYSWCTGTLVWHNIVLTNAHCVLEQESIWSEGEWAINNIQVLTARGPEYESKVAQAETVWVGTRNPMFYQSQDWALLKLNWSLGNETGYLGFTNKWESYSQVNMAGYSSDYLDGEIAGVHEGCQLKDSIPMTGLITHDCDSSPGASGSSLWKKTKSGAHYIVALHRGVMNRAPDHYLDEYSFWYANLAVPVENFVDELIQWREENP